MKSMLERLKLWHKFALLTTLGALMCAVPLTLYLRDFNANLASTRTEIEGIGPIRQVSALQRLVLAHRGQSRITLLGQADPAKLAALQRDLQPAWAAVEQLVKAVPQNDEFQHHWGEALKAWKLVQAGLDGKQFDPETAFAAHDGVLTICATCTSTSPTTTC